MVRGKPLSEDLRIAIVNANKNGKSCRKIAHEFCLPSSTVQDIVKNFKTTKSVKIGLKTGRPPLTSARDLRTLKKIVKSNRRVNISEVTANFREMAKNTVSVSTCSRALKKIGIKSYKAKDKPLLTPKQKKNRLKWAKEHKGWTMKQWNNVIWSDESKFEVCIGANRKRVLRSKEEAFPNREVSGIHNGMGMYVSERSW